MEWTEFGVPDLEPGYNVDVQEGKYQGDPSNLDLPRSNKIEDYVVIPKSKSRSNKMEILIAHPVEGLVILDSTQKSTYSSDMSKF